MNWIDSINKYAPCNEQEQRNKHLFVQCINNFKNVLTRDNEIAHITSSALIVNKTRDKILMIHHNIYNSWSWTGGHADGEEDLLSVAIKEAREETGVINIHSLSSEIFSLDVLPVIGHVKRGRYVSAHLHLSVAYLLEADERELLVVKEDENSGVMWIPIDEVNVYSSEPHMREVYGKLIDKVRGIE